MLNITVNIYYAELALPISYLSTLCTLMNKTERHGSQRLGKKALVKPLPNTLDTSANEN